MSNLDDNDIFISYCFTHSEAPRALFHAKHIKRLYDLAGEVLTGYLSDNGFYTMRADTAHPLCAKARQRIKEKANGG